MVKEAMDQGTWTALEAENDSPLSLQVTGNLVYNHMELNSTNNLSDPVSEFSLGASR